MKKIVLAFDSFKGSLTSREVADAFEEGLLSVVPDAEIRKICIADGGEGTTEALVSTLKGETVDIMVNDPLGRTVKASYGLIDNGKTAIIEMAKASGLTLLSPQERNPMLTSSFGTGEMIADALNRGCRKILIGIGGSATNDGGTGMLQALGYKFADENGNRLKGNGENLEAICDIDSTEAHPALAEAEIIVACDVSNPLYGPTGAAHVFAPQKGADRNMTERLDNGLRKYAKAIMAFNGTDANAVEGGGAAGGMGAALKCILNAVLMRGIDMMLDVIEFDDIISDTDIIVTGEGKIDHQTLMGKAPIGILKRATATTGIPVVAVGGKVEWCKELRHCGFAKIISATDEHLPLETAMQHDVAYGNVEKAGREVGLLLCSGSNTL